MQDDALGITVSPLSGVLGAEVASFGMSPLDLTDLDDETYHAIHEAFLEHRLLVFRDQRLSRDGLLALARRFGVPIHHPFSAEQSQESEITTIVKEPHESESFGGMWNSDLSYLARPPKAALLMAVETPRVGGDMLFACQHRAYESLSDAMQSFLGRLHAVSSSAKSANRLLGGYSVADIGAAPAEILTAVHPAVRRHPETGRPALYLNPAHTVGFDELTPAESAPILDYLFAHQVRPEFTARVHWAPGTVAVWDNRSLLHFSINDFGGRRTEMWRVTLEGDTPEPA